MPGELKICKFQSSLDQAIKPGLQQQPTQQIPKLVSATSLIQNHLTKQVAYAVTTHANGIQTNGGSFTLVNGVEVPAATTTADSQYNTPGLATNNGTSKMGAEADQTLQAGDVISSNNGSSIIGSKLYAQDADCEIYADLPKPTPNTVSHPLIFDPTLRWATDPLFELTKVANRV